jgi:hypothetical protein
MNRSVRATVGCLVVLVACVSASLAVGPTPAPAIAGLV